MGRQLGSFETAATLTDERSPFAVVTVLRLAAGPAPARLRSALAALQRLHPLLGCHVVERGGRRVYESRDTGTPELHRVARDDDDGWQALVEEELNRRPAPPPAAPVRCTYRLPAGSDEGSEVAAPCELVLTFHHAVMDAASGAAVLRRLLALCAPGGEPPAPEPGILPPAEALFPPAYRGLSGARRQLAFLGRQLADETVFRLGSRGVRRPPVVDPVRCRVQVLGLDAAATAALVGASRRRRVTLNSALVAALLLAVHRHLYAAAGGDDGGRAIPLRYITFANLRPYLDPPVTEERLGSLLAMLRYTTAVGPDTGLWPLARQITAQVDAGSRRGDKFCSVLWCERVMRAMLRQRSQRMAASAVSYSGAVRLPEVAEGAAVRGLHAFVSNLGLGPEYTAQARLFGGRLVIDAVYLESDMDDSLAHQVGATIVDALRRAGEEGMA